MDHGAPIAYTVLARSEEHTSELQSHDNLVCRIIRSEEHTSELQSHDNLVCRLLLEKKKQRTTALHPHSGRPSGPSRHAACRGSGPRRGLPGRPGEPGPSRAPRCVHRFFFNDTATTEIYTLSLHDALPISGSVVRGLRAGGGRGIRPRGAGGRIDRKSTRLNSSHTIISYAVFCLKKKKVRRALEGRRAAGLHRSRGLRRGTRATAGG